MTRSIIEKKHQLGGGGGGGGGNEINVKLKHLGGLYTKGANSVHELCNLLSLHCQEGQKYGRCGALPPHLYWCVGSLRMYTLLLVHTGMWLAENMSWVCMLMGSYSCVCWECTLVLGGEKCYLVCWVSNIEF